MTKRRRALILVGVAVAAIAATVAYVATRPKPYEIIEVPGKKRAYAVAVNSREQILIIGMDDDSSSSVPAVYLWDKGNLTFLGNFHPVGLNDLGDVAGNTPGGPVYWHSGMIAKINSPFGINAHALAITAAGDVLLDSMAAPRYRSISALPIYAWRAGTCHVLLNANYLRDTVSAGEGGHVVYGANTARRMPPRYYFCDGGNTVRLPNCLGNYGVSTVGRHGETAWNRYNVAPNAVTWSVTNGLQYLDPRTRVRVAVTAFRDNGQPIGMVEDRLVPGGFKPVIWSHGKFDELPNLGTHWLPMAVNRSGTVVGLSFHEPSQPLFEKLRALYLGMNTSLNVSPDSDKPIIWPHLLPQ